MKYSQQTLDYCRSNSIQISEEVKDEYFPLGDFETKKDAFFDRLDNSDKVLIFPFDGNFLLNKKNFIKIVQTLPEFLASIFLLGFDKVTTFVEFKEQIFNNDILASNKTLRQTAEIILENHALLRDLIISGFTDQSLKIRILNNLKLLKFRKTHYDIIGCFQVIHASFTILLDLPGDTSTRDINIIVPINDVKLELLYSLVGDLSLPLRILIDQTDQDEVDPKIIRAKIINGFANPGLFPGTPGRGKGKAIGKQSSVEETLPEYDNDNNSNGVVAKQIILVPKNAEKRSSKNQIVVNGKDPITVQNAPFDFLYWIAWCDQNDKSQLNASEDISSDYKAQILKGCSEKIVKSRFIASWINKDNIQKKWDAQSQINKRLGINLVGSGSETFSISDEYDIELQPYPIK